ncbi:hypothetical protein BH18CHL2_BH18CHL2_06810 [soil metagenome]
MDPDSVVDRSIVTRDGEPAGLMVRRHPAWEKLPERFDRLSVELRPSLRTPERVGAL